jgi:hypothetical protein
MVECAQPDKGRLLVESERIVAVSFLKQQDSIYLSGIVGAAMKNVPLNSLSVPRTLYHIT